jgi:hypothetical protein
MPLGWGSSATLTSADPTGSRPYTRLRGPLLVGTQGDLATSGGGGTPPHILNVSTMRADVIMGGGNLASSTSLANTGFVYIPYSTYSLVGALPAPTPAVTNAGVALAYDAISNKICVFATGVGEWRSVAVAS